MILVCYDGSVDAQAGIDRVARLLPGAEVTVLVIWETILETMTRNGSLGMGLGMVGSLQRRHHHRHRPVARSR